MANIRTELSRSGVISLNDSTVRSLLGKASGIIKLSDAYGKSAYKLGTPSGYFDAGFVYYSVTGASPGAVITYELWYTTSGQPLGSLKTLGTTNSSGNLSVGFDVTDDPYWYPLGQSNYFHFYQNGAAIGDIVVTS